LHYPQKHYPNVHRSYPRLRSAVQEAWESITHAKIQKLIRGIGDQCIEVILADGGHTKYSTILLKQHCQASGAHWREMWDHSGVYEVGARISIMQRVAPPWLAAEPNGQSTADKSPSTTMTAVAVRCKVVVHSRCPIRRPSPGSDVIQVSEGVEWQFYDECSGDFVDGWG
jgi:hypothetical protein